ncbi:F-box DNA helicase 1-like isoform X2 [Clupea harengus]|uniref:DNA 3'-5' helicase n=1 Tax=Clupea harengus TaxID=7950 RepID=A0A8M1K9E2_CLUHA|nr:F-box DNA helicase 1-like isoform X2 [Clupea harengus]
MCLSSHRENQLTQEQKQILNHNTERDHVVKIMAFAGTGKTTTLIGYAKQRPKLRFLYVVFNKSAQMQAKDIFPGNVSCKTIHALALAALGKRYRKKLHFTSLNLSSVFAVMPAGQRSIVWANVVTKTINNFWASTHKRIVAKHVPESYKDTHGNMCQPNKTEKKMVLKHAMDIWKKMKQVQPTSELAYRMYHDGYLKLWQLKGAKMKELYDVIFIDEAQDCTPVAIDSLMSQQCAKILVGDPHQHIYSFRGAINNLDMIQHTHIFYLTQSFRFGPEIAYVGATILEVGKRERKTLIGGGEQGSVQGQDTEMWSRFRTGVGGADGRLAVLSRTNFSIFNEAVRLINLESTSRIHIIGGIEAFGMSTIHDIWALKQNLQIKDPFIRRFSEGGVGGMTGYRGLRKYAEITENQEDGLLWKIDAVEKYGERIPDLLKLIRRGHQTRQQNADFILGTVHKAKGLEFDTVVIMDDFGTLKAFLAQEHGGNQSLVEDDDWNLMYVAVTRAKRTLFMSGTITDILARAGEYFLRSKLTTVPAESPAPQCAIEGCSNPINTETRLSMHRLPITYVDGREQGGAVCLACVHRMAGHLAFLMSPGIERVPFP